MVVLAALATAASVSTAAAETGRRRSSPPSPPSSQQNKRALPRPTAAAPHDSAPKRCLRDATPFDSAQTPLQLVKLNGMGLEAEAADDGFAEDDAPDDELFRVGAHDLTLSPPSSDSSYSDHSSNASFGSFCVADFGGYPENARRRQMLDLSIMKVQSPTTPQQAASLRRSVLIFNTIRCLQEEIASVESSPTSDRGTDEEGDCDDDVDGTGESAEAAASRSFLLTNQCLEQLHVGGGGAQSADYSSWLGVWSSGVDADPQAAASFDPMHHQAGINASDIIAALRAVPPLP